MLKFYAKAKPFWAATQWQLNRIVGTNLQIGT